jgi:hypothetical protein
VCVFLRTNKILYSLAEKEALSKFKEEFKSLKDPFNISSRDSIYFDYAIKIKVNRIFELL